MSNFLAMLKIAARIYILIAIPAIGMIVFVLFCSDRIESALMFERQEQTRKVVELGKSIADSYAARAKSGEFSVEEAQRRALRTFEAIRFDGSNYLYVISWSGTMTAHPDSSMVGKSVIGLTNARGEKVFENLLGVANRASDSFQYYWKDTDGQEKLKVTYAINIPEWKWIIASGIFADSVKTSVSKIENGLYVASAIIVAIAALAALIVGNSITGPVNALNRAMDKLAGGDNSGEIGMNERRDEIGSMARTVAVFQENAREMERMRAERAEMERRTAAQKKEMMNRLADDLNRSVGEIVNTVSAAASQLRSNSEQLASLSDHTNRLATSVAAATEEASTNVSSVASATEELSASIGEINRQVAESSQAAQEAVHEVERTNSTVSTLSDAAMQIGDVVKLIQDIAGQTNLLALNATIEAARAGEAGKGFAVVASEVKGLANQTARATDEISTKIVTIQTVSTEAATAFQVVGDSIARMDKIAEDVANAIGEQTAATREISTNIQQVSAGTNEVSKSITSVTEAAQDSHRAASEVLSASQELMKQAQTLRGEIEGFVAKIRTA